MKCISEPPVKGMKGKHLCFDSHASLAKGSLAGIHCCPRLGCIASGGHPVGWHQDVCPPPPTQEDGGAGRIPYNVPGYTCVKLFRVCKEAAGLRGEALGPLRGAQESSV